MSIRIIFYHIIFFVTISACQKRRKRYLMYKNKSQENLNNICGKKIKQLRLEMKKKTSQRQLADMLVLQGLDIDKNAIQRIESGQRFVTDIELKVIANVLNTSYNELLGEPNSNVL